MHPLTLHPKRRENQEDHAFAQVGRFVLAQLVQEPIERDENQWCKYVDCIPSFHQRIWAKLFAEDSRGYKEHGEADGEY